MVDSHINRCCIVASKTAAREQKSKLGLCPRNPLLFENPFPYPRGSHIYVTCRSVCDCDQESWSVKIILDRLITPFRGFWSLDFTGVQRTKCSHASVVSKKVHWLVDISRSEFVLIPWKKNVDRLILFWSQSQTLLQATHMWLPLVTLPQLAAASNEGTS